MEPNNQDSNVEVKQCFVLLERIDLKKYNYNDSSDPIALSNLPFLLSLNQRKTKYEKRNLPLSHLFSYSEKEPHKCKVCERSFKTVKSYNNHVRYHSKRKSYCCEECGASFYAPTKLRLHIRYRHTKEKPYRCAECDRAFVEMGKLKRHIQLCHTGERPYECPFCVYASADNFKLKRHLLVHTGEKPYECDICQARFRQKKHLQLHKFIHSNIYPFPCEFCSFMSRRKQDLNIHMRRCHTEKHLKCLRCEKILPDRYSYKLHSKTHEGEKCKCSICPYECNRPWALKRHMYKHTSSKPYKCDECDKSFIRTGLLRNHKNRYHNPTNSDSSSKEKSNERSIHGKAFRRKGLKLRNKYVNTEENHHVENVEKANEDEFGNDE